MRSKNIVHIINGDIKSGHGLIQRLLNHIIFKVFIMAVALGNCVMIGFRTKPMIVKEYEAIFSACDIIIFTVFLLEILLKLCTGFRIFWKNSWNLLDFAITVVLIAVSSVSYDFDDRVITILQLIRSFRLFGHTKESSVISTVFTDSVFELINVFLLLGGSMVLFALIGVLLFKGSAPSAFADLPTALFTLFICVTQDGWIEIQNKLEIGDSTLMYGVMVYFIIFICVGAFIFANFIIAVIITNLHIAAEKYEGSSMMDKEDQANDQGITHVEEVIKNTQMTTQQRCRMSCRLDNLNMENFENLLLVSDAIHTNQRKYLKLHQELERILEEVSRLPKNRQQEEEVMLQSQVAASMEENILSSKIASGRTGDMLSTLIALEKANIIDSSAALPQVYAKGSVREGVRRMSMAAVEARRLSVV